MLLHAGAAGEDRVGEHEDFRGCAGARGDVS
jgi:hypothetical protein